MTEQEMKDFLEANAEEIKLAVKVRMIDSLVSTHKWEMTGAINDAVNEFIKAEVIPEVKKHLEGEKGAIIAAATEGSRQIGNMLAQEMVKRAAKNMEGYSFRELVKGLFG